MNGIREEFERTQFSRREKTELAARLARAAEQEENMTEQTKRKVKKISRGVVVGIAAALTLTVGALAATIGPDWGGLFSFQRPEGQELLDKVTDEIGETRTAGDWEVTLSRCAGDDEMVYVWIEMKAPEDFVYEAPEAYMDLFTNWDILVDGKRENAGSGDSRYDWDGETRTLSYWSGWPTGDPVAGKTVDIVLEPLRWDGWDPETEQWVAVPLWDGDVTFEGVELDYENMTIRLEPNIEVPYLDGTATLTRLEISPFRALARVEGGSCYRHHWVKVEEGYQPEQGEAIESAAGTITVGGSNIGRPEVEGYRPSYGAMDCWQALTVEFHMKDGTVLTPKTAVLSGCQDGFETPNHVYTVEECYVERRLEYKEEQVNGAPEQIIDPSQVDYVTVCGVDIPVQAEN